LQFLVQRGCPPVAYAAGATAENRPKAIRATRIAFVMINPVPI
jgi:hypothetical protein